MKILILIFFLEIKESKITRGHNFTLAKKQSNVGPVPNKAHPLIRPGAPGSKTN